MPVSHHKSPADGDVQCNNAQRTHYSISREKFAKLIVVDIAYPVY